MFSPELLERSKRIALADVNVGHRFRDAPFLNPKDATALLQAGDIVIHYVPQLRSSWEDYNEHLLKGFLHLSTVATFGKDTPYKVELVQQGIFCDECIFTHFNKHEVFLRRFFVVVRSRRASADDRLRRSLNDAILALSGYEDNEGLPVKVRNVKVNFFLRTHKLTRGQPSRLPHKLYCSELAYLAYKMNGIDICELRSLDDLVKMTSGLPGRRDFLRLARQYAMGSECLAAAFFLFTECERLAGLLRLDFLKPSRIFFKDGAWPTFIVENPEFDIVAVVPPPERHIRAYEALIPPTAGSAPPDAAARTPSAR